MPAEGQQLRRPKRHTEKDLAVWPQANTGETAAIVPFTLLFLKRSTFLVYKGVIIHSIFLKHVSGIVLEECLMLYIFTV